MQPGQLPEHYALYCALTAINELSDAMKLEPQPAAQPTDSERQLTEEVAMVRTFPVHIGDYDAGLPQRRAIHSPRDFSAGWSMAVIAINDRLTVLQAEQRRRDGKAVIK